MRERGHAGEPGAASFGAALRGHRRAAGLTQEALAERAGVGVRTLQGLERGEAHPLRATTRRLTTALALPAAARARFLAAAAPPPRPPGPPTPPAGGPAWSRSGPRRGRPLPSRGPCRRS